MFRVISRRMTGIAILLTLVGVCTTEAQVESLTTRQLKERAEERFESEQYSEALSDFRHLMNEYPGDPMYRYYTGICLTELNRDLEEAAELLYFASRRDVPAYVYYHLAEAHRRMYDFKEAKNYYLEFDREASRRESREYETKKLIRSVETAREIVSTYNPYEVLNVTFVNLDDKEQVRQIRMKGGVLQEKPEAFFTEGEDRDELTRLMFIPEQLNRGDHVYYSGYNKRRKDGAQLFRARRTTSGKWNQVTPLDDLNTGGDEIMPYYDPVGRDLYFASNGRQGVGGFDLYKSHYDEERDEWSDPVNLGFPANSVYDDYLVLPGTDLGMLMFFSARQATDSTLAVYRVHFSEPKKSLASHTPEEIRRIANLGGVAGETLEEMEAYQASLAQASESSNEQQDASPSEHTTIESSPGAGKTAAAGTEVDRQYQTLVGEALHHQEVSDSLTELATEARVRVRESDDPNDRWLYQKQILMWEKKAADEQAEADRLFARLNEYEPGSTASEREVPSTIVKDREVNDITVYRFADRDEQETSKGNREAEPGEVAGETRTRERSAGKNEQGEEGPGAGRPGEPGAAQSEKKSTAGEKSTGNTPSAEPRGSQEPKNTAAGNRVHKAGGKTPVSVVINRFDILDASPYSYGNPIPVNIRLPQGAFYRIQLGAYSKAVVPGAFGGLSPVTAETLPERGLTKYYVGKFNRYEDAALALDRVRKAGHTDAFIVAWYDGEKMSPGRVQKLE